MGSSPATPANQQKKYNMDLDLSQYFIVEEKPVFNLSIKLVIPSGCGMKCPFCFNLLNKNTAVYDKEAFLNNFIDSLNHIIDTAGPQRSISLDITGNEPTHDIGLFIATMQKINSIKHRFNKIVLTTNGENLSKFDVLKHVGDVVNFVNLSVHHYNESERCKAFGVQPIDSLFYGHIIDVLHNYNIKVTAVAVLYKELNTTFVTFVRNFAIWAKKFRFDNIRIRSNFYKKDDFFTRYMNDTTFGNEIIRAEGLNTKYLDVDGMEVILLQGVTSLIGHVVGVEAVVDDDGKPYIDYGKCYPFNSKYIEHVYVLKK